MSNSVRFVFVVLLTVQAYGSDIAFPTLMEVRATYANGDYVHAERQLRTALNEPRSVAESALILGDLGILMLMQERLDEAEEKLNQATALVKSNPSVDRRYLPILLGNLGVVYQRRSRPQQSESLLREALQAGTTLLANKPEYLADLQVKLGILHFSTGKGKLAERDFRKALTLVEKGRGSESPATAGLAALLADVLTARGVNDEAERLYSETLATQEKAFGFRTREVATTLEHLAVLLRQAKNDRRALEIESRAQSIRSELDFTVSVKKKHSSSPQRHGGHRDETA
jgi:tetratricopeptide (TPR) repeat protein